MARVRLEEAIKFHGHLGPYLVLGILAGETALKKLKMKRYFGLEVKVYGADKRPKSCLIDGLQLSTGATYGKGNIQKFKAKQIRIEFYNQAKRKKITLKLKDDLRQNLGLIKTHKDSEFLATRLYNTGYLKLFNLYQKATS